MSCVLAGEKLCSSADWGTVSNPIKENGATTNTGRIPDNFACPGANPGESTTHDVLLLMMAAAAVIATLPTSNNTNSI